MKEDISDLTNQFRTQRNCKNCSKLFEGQYCKHCGQKWLTGRFTLKESISDLFNKVFNLERGLFYTFNELLIRPEQTLQQYLKKATVNYMHPFRFAFILATISALLTVVSGVFDSSFASGFVQGYSNYDDEKAKQASEMIAFVKQYYTLFLLLGIPITSVGTRIIYFRKRLYFAEHLILNAYTYGLTIGISIPFLLLFLLPNGVEINSVINLIIYSLGYAWVFSKFFKENYLLALLKSLFAVILSILIVGLVVFVLAIAASFVYKFLKP